MEKLEPTIFIVFGITGNLAQHKLLPALYHLVKDDLLHEHTEIIGVSRRATTIDALLDKVELCVIEEDNICDPEALKKFRHKLHMIQLDPVKGEDYDALLKELNKVEEAHGMCMNRLFYLSIPPQVYDPVIHNLGAHHLQKGCPHNQAVSRLLVEKPFGYDLVSATELIKNTERYFTEEQVFRIDHYLAKETVQNILVFRQQNPIFTELWNGQHIRAIDLRLDEQVGVDGRTEFYDNIGALRDMVQSHLMQLMSLVTMDIPHDINSSAALHKAKHKLLEDVLPVDPTKTKIVRAQYKGYREEVENPHSRTETYTHVNLTIDNAAWRDVPITLATGKAMQSKKTIITITFKPSEASKKSNKLTFRIQPNEGIDIELTIKRPAFENKLETVQMDFSYHGTFSEPRHPDAYERVLVDAVKGDHGLFTTSQEVLAAWRILQPILDAWTKDSSDLQIYERGWSGPQK